MVVADVNCDSNDSCGTRVGGGSRNCVGKVLLVIVMVVEAVVAMILAGQLYGNSNGSVGDMDGDDIYRCKRHL